MIRRGAASLDVTGKQLNLYNLIESCRDRYDTVDPVVNHVSNERRATVTPLPLIPGRQALPEAGATHRVLNHLSPLLALPQCCPHLLDNPSVGRPLERPKMHGKPDDVLEYFRQLH